jgi:hypothetical protein
VEVKNTVYQYVAKIKEYKYLSTRTQLNYLSFTLVHLLMCLLLPDPRDDLGGMDVARKVRYLTISHSITVMYCMDCFCVEFVSY